MSKDNPPAGSDITLLLRRVRSLSGDRAATEELLSAVYGELRKLAGEAMRRERAAHTLQPTALVNEAYVRLVHQEVEWADRSQFFAIAGRAMRQILVEHARGRSTEKRGGNLTRVTLDDQLRVDKSEAVDILDLDTAMHKLEAVDPRAAQIVELRAFAGLTMHEVARILDVSKRTADGDWSMARLFLSRELSEGRV